MRVFQKLVWNRLAHFSAEVPMPYRSIDELPKNVRSPLPKHAQEIYKEAYNSAHEQHKDKDDREERAGRIAWSAVKEKYEKGDDDKWHRKE